MYVYECSNYILLFFCYPLVSACFRLFALVFRRLFDACLNPPVSTSFFPLVFSACFRLSARMFDPLVSAGFWKDNNPRVCGCALVIKYNRWFHLVSLRRSIYRFDA